MSILGRDLKDVILVDNSNLSFRIHPENGLLVRSFFSDSRDKELIRLMPLLIFLAEVYDVREVQDWAATFSEDQFIAFINNKEQENVINKSDYLKDIIGYLKTTYFDDILGSRKRKSFSLKKGREIGRDDEQDASMELILTEDFYLKTPGEEGYDSNPTSPKKPETLLTEETVLSERGETNLLIDDSFSMENTSASSNLVRRSVHNSPNPLEPSKKKFTFSSIELI